MNVGETLQLKSLTFYSYNGGFKIRNNLFVWKLTANSSWALILKKNTPVFIYKVCCFSVLSYNLQDFVKLKKAIVKHLGSQSWSLVEAQGSQINVWHSRHWRQKIGNCVNPNCMYISLISVSRRTDENQDNMGQKKTSALHITKQEYNTENNWQTHVRFKQSDKKPP